MKADWVSGDDKDRDGKRSVEQQVGQTQVLCNCALLTEGIRPPADRRDRLMSPHEKPFALCSDGRSVGPGSRRKIRLSYR